MADRPTVDGFYPRRPNTRGENIISGGGMGFNEPQAPHHHAMQKGPQTLRPSTPVRNMQHKDTYHCNFFLRTIKTAYNKKAE